VFSWNQPKVVPIAHADDKRQIMEVLAVNAKREYLLPQLMCKGKTTCCHLTFNFSSGWDAWHSDNQWSNMKR